MKAERMEKIITDILAIRQKMENSRADLEDARIDEMDDKPPAWEKSALDLLTSMDELDSSIDSMDRAIDSIRDAMKREPELAAAAARQLAFENDTSSDYDEDEDETALHKAEGGTKP